MCPYCLFDSLFLFVSNSRLKPLDIEFMRRLGNRVNLIPVVAKSDSLTEAELKAFKIRVNESEGSEIYETKYIVLDFA